MRLSCPDPVELRHGNYTARVAPSAGGRIASLAWHAAQGSRPLLVEWDGRAFDEHDWPKAGAFPMLPFANRLPKEGFRFAGRVHRPQPGPDGFALHGMAHRRPWTVLDASGDRVVMRWVHEGIEAGWPWPFTARQDVKLGGRGLSVTVSVRNDASRPMPLMMGWHPYHAVRHDVRRDDLQFVAAARLDLDADGRAQDSDREPAFDMRPGETAAFSQWTGRLRLRAQHAGTIVVDCQGANGLVLHRPAAGHYVCVEPVTALPGHLGGRGGRLQESVADGVLLPGQVRQFCWSCRFDPHQA